MIASSAATPPSLTLQQAKGRPMLTWVGKQPLGRVPVFPAQLIETFAPQAAATEHHIAAPNALYHGDNKEVLAHLLANGLRGQVRLIYIDPPFDSGADYVRQVRLRGEKQTDRLPGGGYSLGEQIQYTDMWGNDNYLQFMYERLPLLRELLAEDGTLWLHCDHRKVHHLHLLLEEIFGAENYLNTIAWRSQVARGAKVNAFYFPNSTHSLAIFAKERSTPPLWYPPKKQLILSEAEAARAYQRDEQGFFRTSDPGSYSFASLQALHTQGRLYAPFGGEIVIDEARQQIYPSNGGSLGVKYYLTPLDNGRYASEQAIDNLWDDIPGLGTTPSEEVGYPTQKTEALLERILRVSTNPGDLVLDCFMGSGTTLAVAQKLGRRWIGCDINRGSIQTVSRRLQAILQSPPPAEAASGPQSFALYRVNGYDLPQAGTQDPASPAEAMRLAAELIGIQRATTDSFFEGRLGQRLVKFNPLARPLLPADLAAIAEALAARPKAQQDIVVVCAGKTEAAASWLTTWNQHRLAGRGLQQIEVIDLQTDPRYGPFFFHEPAQARVTMQRQPGDPSLVAIVIHDFISPTLIARLQTQRAQAQPLLTDWRMMVDSIAIDPAYDGEVLRVALADAPPKRSEWVRGSYTLSIPARPTTVAVKITDMLGEEVLVVQAGV
ncbi:MAG: site-specific DNA-methyltransferase [Caldilineaceae bacterium]|nr:site-specific DNA-methyltransferase [Caldilineaceae bacterium]